MFLERRGYGDQTMRRDQTMQEALTGTAKRCQAEVPETPDCLYKAFREGR